MKRPTWNSFIITVAAACVGLAAMLLTGGRDRAPDETSPGAAPEQGIVERPAAENPGGLLLEATTPEELREVLQFCRKADRSDISSLRNLAVTSPDPLVAGNAVRALGRLRAVAGCPGLLALARDPRPRIRQEVVVALGKSGSPSAVEPLAALLEEGEPGLRPLVIQALGHLGGERAGALLMEIMEDPGATRTDRAFARAALKKR